MKKNKLIVIISAVVCAVLAVATMAIAFTYDEHNHKVLSDARVYHVSNNGVYYTREYKDGCVKSFETEATFQDVLMGSRSNDRIVLEEDITLQNELTLTSYSSQMSTPQGFDLNVNLDLNNHLLTTNVDNASRNSVFTLSANYGSINFNVKNGKITTEDLLYIFRFENSLNINDNITLNIDNVECVVSGTYATPLFAHNESSGIKLNANNSKFVSAIKQRDTEHFGVGAFINNENGIFNFNNCYFKGGDAVYVKHGTVNLNGCKLENEGKAEPTLQPSTSFPFHAVGACLVGDTHTSASGMTEYEINVTNCEMIRGTSIAMIYVTGTAEEGQTRQFNDNSSVNIISCTFAEDPTVFPDYDIINYANQTPVNVDGVWVVA